MSHWDVVPLRPGTWEPSAVLPMRDDAAARAFPPDWTGASALLGEVVTALSASAALDPSTPVIRPSDVNPRTGAISDAAWGGQERGFLLRRRKAELVAVPVFPSQPCVVVGERLIGFAFSPAFIVLQPSTTLDARWLWAVLTCTTGMRARRNLASGSHSVRLGIADLLRIRVPVPELSRQRLADLAEVVPTHEELRAQQAQMASRWEVTALPLDDSWEPERLLRPPFDQGEGGVPLEDVFDVRLGRGVEDRSSQPEAGLLPMFGPAWTRSGEVSGWARAGVPVQQGDIIMGTMGRPVWARQAEVSGLAWGSVLVLRPRDEYTAANVARLVWWLNRDVTQAVLATMMTGSTIPRLVAGRLRELRVPALASIEPPSATKESDLARILEGILWR